MTQLAIACGLDAGPRRRRRRSKKVAELGVEGEQPGRVGFEPELGGVAVAALLGKLGERRARRLDISAAGASGTRSGSGK